MTLLVQILGGLTGIAVAYAMHRFVERPYERSTAEARVKFEEEMEKLRKKKQALKK
jgi:membrane protein YqaA with SNARE-associated domain